MRVTDLGDHDRALTRFRELDGRLRRVTATARSRRTAEALFKERLLDRAGYGSRCVITCDRSPERGPAAHGDDRAPLH
jgi:hypothetical protein